MYAGSIPATRSTSHKNKKKGDQMFMVYWIDIEGSMKTAQCKEFSLNEMAGALQFAEELRGRQRAGEAIGHITMSAENPDSVGLAGVAEPAADYSWKKRRV